MPETMTDYERWKANGEDRSYHKQPFKAGAELTADQDRRLKNLMKLLDMSRSDVIRLALKELADRYRVE